jgi:adenosylhomocysteinase
MGSGDLRASAEKGMAQITWARRSMPLSAAAIAKLTPEDACHIGLGLPVDPASSSLALGLLDAGFEVSVLNSHPSENNGDLLAALESSGAAIFEDRDGFVGRQIDIVLDTDGGLLEPMSQRLKGATIFSEEAAEKVQSLPLPVIDLAGCDLIKDCALKNGIGQASVSGFLDITNLQIAGREVLVLGYGAIGEGVVKFARAYGARVMVYEEILTQAVRAQLDGHRLVTLWEALLRAEVVFCTSSTMASFGLPELDLLPDGAFLCSAMADCNTNPFIELLNEGPGEPVRDFVSDHRLPSGKGVKLVADGMPIHIEVGQGLPFEYADVVVAAQLHAIALLTKSEANNGVQSLPVQIETALASAILDRE